MKFLKRDVYIKRNINTKNTYIRVKEDLNIYVSTNIFVPSFSIKEFLKKKETTIKKMIEKKEKELSIQNNYYYLGKAIQIKKSSKTYLEDSTLYLKDNDTYQDFLRREAKKLYPERLKVLHSSFSYSVPFPSLVIRKMKTRWGVLNRRSNKMTLNLELMKYNRECLDYVIIHELSHFIEGNHSYKFWDVVKENCPSYKIKKKELNSGHYK